MNIIDCTPPADTPPEFIVWDRYFTDGKQFYLQVQAADGSVSFVELDAITLPEAVGKAHKLGHNPLKWKEIKNDLSSGLRDIPKSIMHNGR